MQICLGFFFYRMRAPVLIAVVLILLACVAGFGLCWIAFPPARPRSSRSAGHARPACGGDRHEWRLQ